MDIILHDTAVVHYYSLARLYEQEWNYQRTVPSHSFIILSLKCLLVSGIKCLWGVCINRYFKNQVAHFRWIPSSGVAKTISVQSPEPRLSQDNAFVLWEPLLLSHLCSDNGNKEWYKIVSVGQIHWRFFFMKRCTAACLSKKQSVKFVQLSPY